MHITLYTKIIRGGKLVLFILARSTSALCSNADQVTFLVALALILS